MNVGSSTSTHILYPCLLQDGAKYVGDELAKRIIAGGPSV